MAELYNLNKTHRSPDIINKINIKTNGNKKRNKTNNSKKRTRSNGKKQIKQSRKSSASYNNKKTNSMKNNNKKYQYNSEFNEFKISDIGNIEDEGSIASRTRNGRKTRKKNGILNGDKKSQNGIVSN